MHKTLLGERFRIAGRTKWQETVNETQTDLNAYPVTCNEKRPHQGRMMKGRTPLTMSTHGIP